MAPPKISKTPNSKVPSQWVSSLRYMLAELRPLGKPEVWASGVILIILGLFAWEYWNQPSDRNDFAGDQPDYNFVTDDQAIAQDIDNSALLRQDLDSSSLLPSQPLNIPTTINLPNTASGSGSGNNSTNKSSLAPGVAAFLALMANSANPPSTTSSSSSNSSMPTAGLTGNLSAPTGGLTGFNPGGTSYPSSGGLFLANPSSNLTSGLSSPVGSGAMGNGAIAPTNPSLSTPLAGTGLNSFTGNRGINATGTANTGLGAANTTGLAGVGNSGVAVGQSSSYVNSPLPGAAPVSRPGIYIPPTTTPSYYTPPAQLAVPSQVTTTPAIAPTSLNGVNAPYAVPGNQVGNGLGNPTNLDQPITPSDMVPDPFSVPRAVPGRYIGNGKINTFANP